MTTLFSSPKTSIMGVLVLVCTIIEKVWPEYTDLCTQVINVMIGAGLVTAADAAKRT